MTYQGQFEALADATRRSIVDLLGEGPRSGAEIAAAVLISRPAVSQHLKVLEGAQLVAVRPLGTRRIYSLDPRGLAAVRAYFERFWTGALDEYARAVAEPTRDDVPTEREEQQ
jgi:DNA-binding transcriptional ArsR family regulator